jgi:hypothetical protein
MAFPIEGKCPVCNEYPCTNFKVCWNFLELQSENAALRQQLEDTKQCYELEIRNLKNRLSKQIDDNLDVCWENALLTERLERLIAVLKKVDKWRGLDGDGITDPLRTEVKRAIEAAK